MSKNILIIALSFPPNAKVGAKRFFFLSQYFKKKFNVKILALNEKYYKIKDFSLVYNGDIHRIKMYPAYPFEKKGVLSKSLFYIWTRGIALIDPFCGSILPGIIEARKIIKKNPIDAIIATGPPFSSFIIGYALKKEFGSHLILDYRDPWTTHRTARPFSIFFGRVLNSTLEKKIVSSASAIVFNTEKMKKYFDSNINIDIPNSKCFVISNGFLTSQVEPANFDQSKINIVYAGSLYGKRNLKNLLLAISKLEPSFKNKLILHIYGTISNDDKTVIELLQLNELIRESPPVPYNQYLSLLKGADILLLILGEQMDYAVSYKMYDYLSMKKPVLAIVPEGSQVSSIIQKVGCGEYARIDDPDDIITKLRYVLEDQSKYSFNDIEAYSWDQLGNEYTQILDTVIK
jgi:glycosyltransferase involved in cell wall biosynthesis